jgi:hypothetical protein
VELEPSEREQADLAAMADGSLPAARRTELEDKLAASPALREALERQRATLATVRDREEDPAPERLRAWLRDQDAHPPAPTRWRLRLWTHRPDGDRVVHRPARRGRQAGALAAAGAVAAIAVMSLLLDGGAGADTAELAAAAARPPSAPAPGHADALRLAMANDGLRFPDWEPRMGWRAAGVRTDRIDGRRAVTVTYARGGRHIAYAILARPNLDLPRGDGPYRALRHHGRPAVAWDYEGRTCLLLGDADVPERTLLRLAASVRFY